MIYKSLDIQNFNSNWVTTVLYMFMKGPNFWGPWSLVFMCFRRGRIWNISWRERRKGVITWFTSEGVSEFGVHGPWFSCVSAEAVSFLTSDSFLRFFLIIYMLQVQCHSKMYHNYAWLVSYSCFSPASVVSIMVGRKHYFMDIWTIQFHIMDSYGYHVQRNLLLVAA